MGRRSDHTREELMALAIRAGSKIIEEKGFQQFSARAAAARIGYAVGTIYHVFGSLDSYILHINAATLDEWYSELNDGAARHGSEPVHFLAKGYLAFARRNRRRFDALFEHHLEEGTPVPEWYAAKSNRLFTLVEAALAERYADAAQARYLARLLWANVHGITVLALSGKLDSENGACAEKLIGTMLELTLGGGDAQG
jgi:AcrR family transcriptional regulator